MTRRRRHCANVRVFFQIEDASPRRPGVFGRAGSHPGDDGSRNKRESGHLRPRFASRGIILPSSATRDSTRTHSVPQPAATSFGKSIPLPAFLLLSLRDALRYQAWRGCQRTSGLAHARPPHGIPQPRRGRAGPTHPTAALHWRAPSKNWPGRVAPPDTFRSKISPGRRHRPRRGQPAIHTSTPPDPKPRHFSAPNSQLTSAPQRRQKQR